MIEIQTQYGTVRLDDDLGPFVSAVGISVCGNPEYPRVLFRMRQVSTALFKPGKGFVVDHINGDPLDNRRENLQVLSIRANTMKARTTPHPGVTAVASKGRWRATVGKRRHRDFRTIEEAQLAADAYRRSLGIKGMPLNFPDIGEHYWDGRRRDA
jgi:hypothetical protein